MDADELSTPGYSVLSPATRTKLATLEKGQLMIRHPHFTQPIFVKFPRPAVMTGRAGAEQFPQGGEVSLDVSVYRSLRSLDSSITLQAVQEAIGLHEDAAVLRARSLVLQERPATDVLGAFRARLPRLVTQKTHVAPPQIPALRGSGSSNPYDI
jgi:hypothetical protein